MLGIRSWFVGLLAPVACLAQTYTGSIGGTVIDGSGSGVPSAQVSIRYLKSNAVTKTTTGAAGDFLAPFLQPGTYEVSVTAKGFKEAVRTGIEVQISQPVRLEIPLAVGEVTERVEVSASAAELNTVSSEIGYSVGEQVLVNLPLVNGNSRGRSPLLLSKILPGVSSTSTNNSNINNFSFGGGRPVSNEILVDGLPTTNVSDQTYTFTPSPESLQELRVLTAPFSAEYGHTGGGVMALSSKSGGNQYRGMVFDFFRNRILNARAPFQGDLTQKYVQNTPGGNIGGPVRLPGYDGKNKTFFFADFNVTLANTGGFFQSLVPTAAERAGDFSQTILSGRPAAIYDPATTRQDSGRTVRDPFPASKVPAARIDAVSGKIAAFFPQPNAQIGGNNFAGAPPTVRQTWQWLARVDHIFNDHDRGFFRAGGYNPNSDAVIQIPNKANNGTAGGFTDLQLVANETHVFSSRAVNDFRAGLTQEINYTYPGDSASPELGLNGVPLNEFPIVNIAGFLRLGSNSYSWDRNRSYVFSEALTYQAGKHNLRMGGDYRWQMYNNYSPGKLAGTYAFSPTFSGLPGTAASGYAFADFLLGTPASASFSLNDYTYRMTVHNGAAYVQDDWKASRRLTVNLGVRWQYNGPFTEKNDQFASFSPTAINRTTGTPGEVLFAGRNGAPRSFVPSQWASLLPRVGLAWRATERTVIRSGLGMYRLPSIGFADWWPVSQYSVSQAFTSTDGVTPPFTFAAGVPARRFNVDSQGRPNVPASLTSPSSSVRMLDFRERWPYTFNWQAGVQRMLPGAWLLEVNYAASKGVKLPIVLGINQLRPQQFRIPQQQSLRPFPQYQGVSLLSFDGNSMYHSLQAALERRWKSGFQMMVSFTWSKVITDVDGPARTNATGIQDVFNLRNERGIAGYDVPRRFVTSYVYDLPFGRGRRFLTSLPLVSRAIADWQLSGITEFQTGLPLPVANPSNQLGGFTATQRPLQTAPAPLPRGGRTLDRWFDTSAFAPAGALQFGTASRFPLYRPGINNWDASLMRNFAMGDRWKLQFRGALYNTFNHGQYGAPGTTLNTPQFGRISSGRDPRVTEVALRIFF
ncbi:MAG: carboxypeptidase regulatory-like domain-containing protein [Bryobacteraceae bacterium]